MDVVKNRKEAVVTKLIFWLITREHHLTFSKRHPTLGILNATFDNYPTEAQSFFPKVLEHQSNTCTIIYIKREESRKSCEPHPNSQTALRMSVHKLEQQRLTYKRGSQMLVWYETCYDPSLDQWCVPIDVFCFFVFCFLMKLYIQCQTPSTFLNKCYSNFTSH